MMSICAACSSSQCVLWKVDGDDDVEEDSYASLSLHSEGESVLGEEEEKEE